MNIRFLRHIDRLVGPLLLLILAPLARVATTLLPASNREARHHIFLKLKGGGSLIIAMPALLAMRRAAPAAIFTLVCTTDTKIYAELTGIFDQYAVIDDKSPITLLQSAIYALKVSFRADICIDLEANSLLAAVFTTLTLAKRRLGLVKPEERYRALAYTEAISFNVFAPIYVFYDQLATLVGAAIPAIGLCTEQLQKTLPKPLESKDNTRSIGIAAFTSDFAPERMMPASVWAELLKRQSGDEQCRILLLGSEKNKKAAEDFISTAQESLPKASFSNLCGKLSLKEAAASFINLDEFWSVDSGLLHIARLLGIPCRSFWGPTNPAQRLRPIEELVEKTLYSNFTCSPCVHLTGPIPCKGNNLCMKTIGEIAPNRAPLWRV